MYAVAIDPSDTLEPERLQRLIEVGRGLLSELHVEAVLDRAIAAYRTRFNKVGIFENARPGLVAQAFGGADRRRRAKG